MKSNIQNMALLPLLFVVTSCSFLGERQESTRIDLDESKIPQMKVITSKGKKDSKKGGTDTAQTTGVASAYYEAKYVDPTTKAVDFIKQTNISLKDVGNESHQLDTAAIFFDLGALLKSNTDTLEATPENLKKIAAYSEAKVKELEKTLACGEQLQSAIIEGSALVDPENAALGDLLSDADKKMYLKADLDDAAKETAKYKDLKEAMKAQLNIIFVPELNKIRVAFAHHMLFCKAAAFISDYKDYVKIDPANITVEDGKVTLRYSKLASNQEIADTKLLNPEVPSLGQLEFGLDKKSKVFSNKAHKKEVLITVMTEKVPASTTTAQTSPDSEDADEESEEEDYEEEVEPARPLTETEVIHQLNNLRSPATAQYASTGAMGGSSTTLATFTQGFQPATTVIKQPTHVITPITDEELQTIVSASSYLKDNTATSALTPTWFNPSLQKHSQKFYVFEGGKYVYKPGKRNVDPWNDSFYGTETNLQGAAPNPMLSDQQVQQKCSDYKYQKTMQFKVRFEPTRNAIKNDFYVWPNGSKMSFRQVLMDQLSVDTDNFDQKGDGEDDEDETVEASSEPISISQQQWENSLTMKQKVVNSLINAALYLPEATKTQLWDLTTCFQKKSETTQGPDYLAFFASDETRTIYKARNARNTKFLNKQKAAVADRKNPTPWIQNSVREELDPNINADAFFDVFNKDRKNPHSYMKMTCIDRDGGKNCFMVFQFPFKRETSVNTLWHYLNPAKIMKHMHETVYLSFEEIKALGGVARNEIWVAGGFKIDLKGADKSVEAFYSPNELFSEGAVTQSLDPEMASTFPGDNCNLEYEIKKIGAAPASSPGSPAMARK
jgi:hypothetical protein